MDDLKIAVGRLKSPAGRAAPGGANAQAELVKHPPAFVVITEERNAMQWRASAAISAKDDRQTAPAYLGSCEGARAEVRTLECQTRVAQQSSTCLICVVSMEQPIQKHLIPHKGPPLGGEIGTRPEGEGRQAVPHTQQSLGIPCLRL